MLSFALLGDFCVKHGDKPVAELDAPRLQSLLAYLILHRANPQSRAHLSFLFWPDTSETQARTNLRNLLHNLRHALPEANIYLDVNVHTLQWRSKAPFTLDVTDFLATLDQADQALKRRDLATVRVALEGATALYKGDLLPSCYDDWIIPVREELCQAYLKALGRLIQMLEDLSEYPTAILYAQRLLQVDPLHETTYRCLIRLYALNGDRARALRTYHACVTVLQRELDVEPSPLTREAYEQLLGTGPRPSPNIELRAANSFLVGREQEWVQILHAWRQVIAGEKPQTVILSGEAGIGKTRLVEELLQWTARQGIASANARCYAAEGELAFAPVIAWLRTVPLDCIEDVWLADLARLLPEVLSMRPDLPQPAPLTEAWQRQQLFEALSRAILSASQPMLLTIDDLQWCDRDSMEWLHFLLRFDNQARLLLVGTYRPEEIGKNHFLHATLHVLRMEERVTEIELQPLDQAETHTLASHVAGVEISQEWAQRLYQETEGNPLFVVETVRAGLPGDRLPDDIALPPKVQSVLEARLAQLSRPTRELAGLAATIGREFSFSLLANASRCDEDTLVRELDELWHRRIVREHGADAYDFSHEKLREVAYSSMSAARRRLLHQHVANALEMLHSRDLDTVSRQVASHYERAGLPALAMPYYLRAARVARQVYANDESSALLQRGLALAEQVGLNPGAEGVSQVAAQLWEELGDIHERQAEHRSALQAFQNALDQVPHIDRVGKARLYRKAGTANREQRRYAEALDACRQAEIALGKQPGEAGSGWWDEWIEVKVEQVWGYYWLAQWPEMEGLVKKVQPVVQERGSVASRIRFLMAKCLLCLRRDRYVVSDEMLANSREALAASLEMASLKTRIDCQFELGFLHLWRRELEQTEEHLLAALEMAVACGMVLQRTHILTYLTILYRFRGKTEGVSKYAIRAQEAALAAQMPEYIAAARANQAWLAWRDQDLSSAEQIAREALMLWRRSPLVYPFQWQAIWPLLGVALTHDQETEVWAYAQALLEPTQQLLPEMLNSILEAAVQAHNRGMAGEASANLARAMKIAQAMGYL